MRVVRVRANSGAVVLVASLATWAVTDIVVARRLARAERAWHADLGALDALVHRHPPTGVNPSAIGTEALAGAARRGGSSPHGVPSKLSPCGATSTLSTWCPSMSTTSNRYPPQRKWSPEVGTRPSWRMTNPARVR